jgi:hypothetical protein
MSTNRLYGMVIAMLFALSACTPNACHVESAPGMNSEPAEMPDGALMHEREWSGGADKFTFAILGDKTGGGYDNWPIFDRSVEEINRLRPDFVIMVGDHVQGFTAHRGQLLEEWVEFREHAGVLDVPLLSVPGNHDYAFDEGERWWNEEKGRPYYDFRYNGVHFVMLNTDQEWENRQSGEPEKLFGDVQTQWVTETLAAATDARHTFVFMHKPAWTENHNPAEWAPIEDALGDRPYTVIAGHWHNLVYERRGDHNYIVHSATGAGLDPHPVKELGDFHHYTMVTVESDSTYFSVEEPGYSWPIDIAQDSFQKQVWAVLDTMYQNRRIVDGNRVAVDLHFGFQNGLPEALELVVKPVLESDNWTPSVDSIVTTIQPGASITPTMTLSADLAERFPIAKFDIIMRYGGVELRRIEGIMVQAYDDSALKIVPEWSVLGPYELDILETSSLPNEPAIGLPGMIAPRGPDEGWSPDAQYEDGATVHEWSTFATDSTGTLVFDDVMGLKSQLLGYASCAIYSPRKQTVGMSIRADNFSRLIVNGEILADDFEVSPWNAAFIPANLNEGWNEVLVKVVNNKGNWNLSFRVTDEDGSLRLAPHRESN